MIVVHTLLHIGPNRVHPFMYTVQGDEVAVCDDAGQPMADKLGKPLIATIGEFDAQTLARAMMREALKQDGFNAPIDYPETVVA